METQALLPRETVKRRNMKFFKTCKILHISMNLISPEVHLQNPKRQLDPKLEDGLRSLGSYQCK